MELFRLFGVVDIQGNMALQQLRDINQQATKTGSTLGAIVKQAAGVAAGFGLWHGFTATAKALSSAFYGLHGQFQSAGMALETMLGSSERAKAMLSDLEDFAARTPFEFPDLMDATQRMLALGFSADEVIPTLQAVGDAAAGLGKGTEGINRIILALGQMQMKGKVTGEEARQLAEAGIPVWEILASAMGKSTAEVQKLSEKGLIPADKAVKALVAGMEAKFPGMMDRLADQAQGAASTIRDNLKMIFKDLTQGAFESLTTTLRGVRDWTDQLRDAFKAGGAKGLYEFLVPPDMRSSLDPLLSSIRNTWSSIVESAKKAGPVFADIGSTALRVLTPMWKLLVDVAGAAAKFAGVIADNWPRIKPVVTSILFIFVSFKTVKGILDEVNKASAAFKAGMELLPKATGFVSKIGTAFMELRTAPNILTGLSGAFKALFGVNPMVLAVSAAIAGLALLAYELYKNWKDVPPFFRTLWDTIKGTFKVGGAAIMVVFREIQLGLAKFLDFTIGNLAGFGAKVASLFEWVPGLGAIATKIKEWYQGVAGWTEGIVRSSTAALGAAKAGVSESSAALGKAWADLKATGSTLGNAIVTDLKGIFLAGKNQVTNALAAITNSANDTGKNIANAMGAGSEAGSAVKQLGQNAQDVADLWRKAGEKIRDALQPVTDALVSQTDRLYDAVVSALKKQYESEKTTRVNALKAAIDAEKQKTDTIIREIERERRAREEATNDALRLRIRSIWAEIDAIDALAQQEERERQEAEDRARILELQAKIAETVDPEERQRLQMELAKTENEIERRKLLEQREARKAELQKQLEDIRFQVEEQYRIFEEQKQREIDYLENEYYPKRLADAAINIEAEKLLLSQNMADILKLLEQYGEGWNDLGKTFGQRLVEGAGPYFAELVNMVRSTLGAVQGAQLAGYSEIDKQIIAAKMAYEQAAAELEEGLKYGTLTAEQEAELGATMTRAHAEAERLRAQGGMIGANVSLVDLGITLPRKHSGGPVIERVSKFLQNAFNLQVDEVPVILKRGEYVLPAMPQVVTAGASFNVTVNVYGSFQDGSDAGHRIGAGIVSELRRLGVMKH